MSHHCRALLCMCMAYQCVGNELQLFCKIYLFRGVVGSVQELQCRLPLLASKHPGWGRALSEHARRVANQRNKRIVLELAAPPRDTDHSQEGTPPPQNLLDIPPGQSAAEHVIAKGHWAQSSLWPAGDDKRVDRPSNAPHGYI